MSTTLTVSKSSYTDIQLANGFTFQLSLYSQVGQSGANAWTPLMSIVPDVTRRVVYIYDWVGGSGTKPDLGYLGTAGIVSDIADATDIRGVAGVGSVSMNQTSITIDNTMVSNGYFTLPHTLSADTRKSLTIISVGGVPQRNHEILGSGSDFALGTTNLNRVYFVADDYSGDSDQDLTGALSDLIELNDQIIVSYLYS